MGLWTSQKSCKKHKLQKYTRNSTPSENYFQNTTIGYAMHSFESHLPFRMENM